MTPATAFARRRVLAPAIALVLALLLSAVAHADQLPVVESWWQQEAAVVDHSAALEGTSAAEFSFREPEAQAAEQAASCADVRFTDVSEAEIGLIATDADLVAESDGSRLCIFFDYRWGSYEAWMLRPRTIEEFRRTKTQLQPRLAASGVDPCHIAFWSSFDQQIRRQITLSDRFDAGRQCTPQILPHGQQSDRRVGEIEEAIRVSATAAAEVFDWKSSWPLRVHAYDNHTDFVAGFRSEGGDEEATNRSLQGVLGATKILANGQIGYLLNVGVFPTAADLRRLVAHEFAHVAQASLLGSPDRLPFFVVEGGAEYFASLVVGAEHKGLADRFQRAVRDERASRAVPLRELVARPADSDERRDSASYSRGYAAMRFLAERWGPASFVRLHRENLSGSPQRFLEGMTRLTGLSLDDFDAALRDYLLAGSAETAPVTASRAELVPNGRLFDLFTARPAAGGVIPTERFTPMDSSVLVMFEFNCLQTAVRGEARIVAPDGRRFATFSGTSGPGCEVRSGLEFTLTNAARALPGMWRVEIYADGVFQGSVTFVME